MVAGVDAAPPRPFSWWWVGIALPSSVAVGVAVAAMLWGQTRADHRDAFDTGWKSSAAVLAVLAAVVTVERLRLGQREHYRLLAADQVKEINELSAKASEQLGSDKAAVRIGGLTDLERLAQAHPGLRQTVVDRICAYLRGPYEPPWGRLDDAKPVAAQAEPDPGTIAERRLELDVRRTAQQILRRHLAPRDEAAFWPGTTLDLRDANLVEFTLADCRVGDVNFEGATFHRVASFENTEFRGSTDFGYTTFRDRAEFENASFRRSAYFAHVRFEDQVSFPRARFESGAYFESGDFGGPTSFIRTVFKGDAGFSEAVFDGESHFGLADFVRGGDFEESEFRGGADFAGAHTTTESGWPEGWIVVEGVLTREESAKRS